MILFIFKLQVSLFLYLFIFYIYGRFLFNEFQYYKRMFGINA
jgi:hypothetical protein